MRKKLKKSEKTLMLNKFLNKDEWLLAFIDKMKSQSRIKKIILEEKTSNGAKDRFADGNTTTSSVVTRTAYTITSPTVAVFGVTDWLQLIVFGTGFKARF